MLPDASVLKSENSYLVIDKMVSSLVCAFAHGSDPEFLEVYIGRLGRVRNSRTHSDWQFVTFSPRGRR